MFARAYKLPFTLWGIPLYLDITFLIVLPFFAWVIAGIVMSPEFRIIGIQVYDERLVTGLTPYALGLVAAIGLFVSVVLHELGHAITGQKYGVKVKNITLWLLGGVAQFEEMPRQRGAEAVVAIVGPIVSVVLGVLFYLLYLALPAPESLPGAAARFVTGYLAFMNILLAIFNMLPALPLDGGRVLRSLLALRMSHLQATQLSAGISKFFAVTLGLLGLLAFNVWIIILALFIYMAVNAETQNSLIVEMLNGLGVRDLMNRDVRTIGPEVPTANLGQIMLQEHHLGFPVVDEYGRVIGMVTLANMQGADPNAAVADIMTREVSRIREDAPALEAFQQMTRNNFGRVLVTDDDGRMSGIITKTDLMRAIQIRTAGLGLMGEEADETMMTEPRGSGAPIGGRA